MLATAGTDGPLYTHLQQLRIADQEPAGGQFNASRPTTNSPFAEPPSSSGGDVTCSGEAFLSSDQTMHEAPQRPQSAEAQRPHSLNGMLSNPVLMPQEEHFLPPRASLDGQPKSSQICFDYTKGLCTRGDKCKYSHDLATIVHFNSREKGICFDYLRNQCHRGLLCRFSHDLSNIAQQCQASEVFNNSQVAKGKTNAICYDFVKGVCQRGNDCRYSHDLSLIARTARGGQQNQRSNEICYDYLRGRCNRGTSCKYSHNISFLASPAFLNNSMGGAPQSSGPMSGGNAMPGGYTSTSLGGALPSGTAAAMAPGLIGGVAGLAGSGRLAPSISADPLMLGNQPAGPPNLQSALNTTLSCGRPSDMDGNTLNTALSSELSDASHQDVTWASGPMQHNAATHVHMQAMVAAQRQRLAAAAAMLSGYGGLQNNSGLHHPHPHHVPHISMPGMSDIPGLLPGAPALGIHGTSFASAAQQHALASSLAAAQQRAMIPPSSVEDNSPSQLHRAHSAPLGGLPLNPNASPVVAESINALLANLGDNPQLLAETLSNLAVAAQAQAAQHAAARMSAPGTGGLGLPQHSAPQPIVGTGSPYESGNNAFSPPSNGYGRDGYHSGPNSQVLLPTSASVPVPEARNGGPTAHMQANSLPGAPLSPDLLPLLKEIWNK